MVIETNVTKLLGIKTPIVGAPMGPFFTNDLAVGICEAGGLGVVSHTGAIRGSLEVSQYKSVTGSLEHVVEHTDKPFGFNLRTSRNESEIKDLITTIPEFIMKNPKLKEQVVYAVTSAGSPKVLPESKAFQKLKEVGNIKHFHVAPALWLADKCIAANVDGLVCTGTEGGGHQSYEKVSTMVLLQQVRQKYPDVPLIGCGGFATGESLAAAIAMGAGGIAMGSRFIATNESEFHEAYKSIIPPAKAGDTRLVTGVLGPIRLWKNKYCMSKELVPSKEELVAKEQKLTREDIEHEMHAYDAVYEGDLENSAVLVGQSIGAIDSIVAVKDLIAKMMNDAEGYLKSAYSKIK